MPKFPFLYVIVAAIFLSFSTPTIAGPREQLPADDKLLHFAFSSLATSW